MRALLVALLVVALAACGGTATSVVPTALPPSSGTPSNVPSESPDFGAIEHPTGSTDVILRFEQGGGFVMPAFLATQAPIFTLYGDGTMIFRNPTLDPLEPIGSVNPMRPFRTAKLSEVQIRSILMLALGAGGLGVARPNYPNDQISDAPTAVFTIDASGVTKTVSIYALGMEVDGMPDGPARAAFARLAGQLGNIDEGGAFATAEYSPARYRGILLEGQAAAPDARRWPWPEIAPSGFISNADPNAFQLPSRVMSPEEAEALGIVPFQGGFQGLTLVGPGDGKVYSFSLRPLLPDEPAPS